MTHWTLPDGDFLRRPGLQGPCRCLNTQYLPFRVRHPECPLHPPVDELRYWTAYTVPVSPEYL